MVHPTWGSSLDGNEDQDSGLRRSSVERNKEADGFARLRCGETKEGDAVGRARLTIEVGAEFPIGITITKPRARVAFLTFSDSPSVPRSWRGIFPSLYG